MQNDWSGNLMARWQAGDQQAADELFRRYASRLVALARGRLPSAMTGRVDPEDVVQSVYRSFFAGASAGRYELGRAGDLWRLLVTITLNKIYRQVAHNRRGKRNVAREESFGSEDSLLALPTPGASPEPSPAEAAALAEEVERILHELEPLQSRVLQMRLEGYSLQEIAVSAGCSQRTVRRALEKLRERLEREQSTGP